MAELATIARPYAEALFKSKVLGPAHQTADLLDGLAQLSHDEQVKQNGWSTGWAVAEGGEAMSRPSIPPLTPIWRGGWTRAGPRGIPPSCYS